MILIQRVETGCDRQTDRHRKESQIERNRNMGKAVGVEMKSYICSLGLSNLEIYYI